MCCSRHTCYLPSSSPSINKRSYSHSFYCFPRAAVTEYRYKIDSIQPVSIRNTQLWAEMRCEARQKNSTAGVSVPGEDVEGGRRLQTAGHSPEHRLDQNCSTETPGWDGSEQNSWRTLRSFSVCSKMSHVFHQPVAESAIFLCSHLSGQRNQSQRLELNKQIRNAGSVLGTAPEPPEFTLESGMLQQAAQ